MAVKKVLGLLVTVVVCFSLAGCGNNAASESNLEQKEQIREKAKEGIFEKKKEMTAEELEIQLEEQELKIVSTEYKTQSEQYKSLYPDMLQVILQNDTEYDIKNAVIAFAAWDENNLPVKIKGSIDFSDGAYIRQVNYSDINLIPGATFGDSYGFEIDEKCGIKSFKAIVVSYEAFSGETWSNPLYNDWRKMYEGVKLSAE